MDIVNKMCSQTSESRLELSAADRQIGTGEETPFYRGNPSSKDQVLRGQPEFEGFCGDPSFLNNKLVVNTQRGVPGPATFA